MLQGSGPLNGLLNYMNYLQKGLAVHTDNLAKTDIPGASAQELKPFSAQVKNNHHGKIDTTNSMHISMSKGHAGGFAVQKSSIDSKSPSGNTISSEDEISKINNLTTEYLKVTRLYQKGLSMMRTILGARG